MLVYCIDVCEIGLFWVILVMKIFVVEGIKFEYDELRCCVSNDEEM